MTQLTEHFTLEEFTDSQTAARKGIPNVPPAIEHRNLVRTAEVMEQVRTHSRRQADLGQLGLSQSGGERGGRRQQDRAPT